MLPSCTFHPTFEVQWRNQQNRSRASFVDARGRSPRWRWNVIPVNLRIPLLNMLSHYRYRVTNANGGGLDACTDDPAIQPLVVATRRCYLQKYLITTTPCKGGHEGSTHPRLKRTRVLLVIVAGRTENFPWWPFRHVHEIPDRWDPMMSSPQPMGGQQRKKNGWDVRICWHRHGLGLTSQVRLV